MDCASCWFQVPREVRSCRNVWINSTLARSYRRGNTYTHSAGVYLIPKWNAATFEHLGRKVHLHRCLFDGCSLAAFTPWVCETSDPPVPMSVRCTAVSRTFEQLNYAELWRCLNIAQKLKVWLVVYCCVEFAIIFLRILVKTLIDNISKKEAWKRKN